VAITPTIRDFLVQLDVLVDAHAWPGLDREIVTVGAGDAAVLVRLPHTRDKARDLELVVDDREVVVTYAPEHVSFTGSGGRDEALRFVEMLGDGRVRLRVRRGLLWTTMESYRDALAHPFRRTRRPWPALRPRTEVIHFGFA
jgi:hypothetical protein